MSQFYTHILYLAAAILMLLAGTRAASSLLPPASDLRCVKSTNLTGACIPLNNSICLGGALPFKWTSVHLAKDSNSLSEVYDKLHLWSSLRNVPQCWLVVQPFLCSVYLPRCDDSKGVELPSKELCERVRKPCQIVEDVKGWPDFLRCDDPNFVSGCKTETYDKLIFNTSGKCEHPLIRTDNPDSWFEGVEGCGIPCDSPLFSKDQHREVHTLVAVFGSLCLFCTLFTMLTFVIDWQNANRYPALILFFINTCFFLGSIGWMAQFAGDARRDIVCRKDGTIRKGEPKLGSDETISCTMVFVLVYYFLVAGLCWFVMLAYAWYLTFVALGTPRDGLTSKTAYFHLVSWCSPLVLTIICLAISEVDGDSVSGICFVGGFNHSVRAVFVLVPVGLVVLVGTAFLLKGVYTLIQIRKEAPVFIPEKTFSKIRDTIIRLGIFTTMALVFALITFAVHVYIFAYEDRWKQSFRDYMYCIANVSAAAPTPSTAGPSTSGGGGCEVEERPSLVAMEIHIFAFFGAGIAMSSWSWTKSSLAAWERFFRWIFHKPSNKPVRLKRHRMIAQAFEKRKEINQGRVSISYRSSHDDPLGMKFDLNSCSDDDLSSTFAMAMPKLVRRRGGLIYPSPGIGRRYSDSDVQSVISTRRVSRESQFLEFREAQFVVFDRDELPYDPYGKKSRKKLKKKRGKLNRIKPVTGPMFSGDSFKMGRNNMMMMMHRRRKESDSSAVSQMSTQSVQVMPMRKGKRHNSVETISMESNNNNNNDYAQDTILPAVTKSSHSNNSVVLDQDSSTLRMHQFLKELKKDHNRERMGGVGGGGGLVGGVGGAGVGMQEVLSLPGAVETSDQEDEVNSVVNDNDEMTQQPDPSQFLKQRGRRQSMACGALQGANNSSNSKTANNDSTNKSWPQKSTPKQNHCVKTTSSSSTVQKKKKTKTETMTTTVMDPMDLSRFPFSPLMADIGGGNWGVLLGKSGSSSGSEVGMGGGGCGYVSGGSFYKPITHNLNSPHNNKHNFHSHHQQYNTAPPPMRESAFHPVNSNSNLHQSSNIYHPNANMNYNYNYNIPHLVNGGYPDHDFNHLYNYNHPPHPHSSYAGSPTDNIYGGAGLASAYMGGAMPYMGGAKPASVSVINGNNLHHPPHHNPSPYHPHQVRHDYSNTGARPKITKTKTPKALPENLGHFPAHVFYNGDINPHHHHNHQHHHQQHHLLQQHQHRQGNSQGDNRGSHTKSRPPPPPSSSSQIHTSRSQNGGGGGRSTSNNKSTTTILRPMKVPNQSFYNSTFEVDEDDVESISV